MGAAADKPEDEPGLREVHARLRGAVLPLFTASTRCLQLGELGKEARHDWSWLVHEFNGFVAIDDVAATVTLIVVGLD